VKNTLENFVLAM